VSDSTVETQTRLHGLDAARAIALLLGIVLHAGLSFVPGVEFRKWPVSDVSQSPVVSVGVYVIHVFRMSVFFWLAGFFGSIMLGRLGVKPFLRDRARRILAPLAIGWVVSFVLLAFVGLWALARKNGGELPWPLPSDVADAPPNFLHLWFLYILLWLYAITLGLRHMVRALDPRERLTHATDRVLGRLLSSHWGAPVLSLPIAGALASIQGWRMGEGVPTPAFSILPPAASLFVFAYVFVLGWLVDRQRALLRELESRWLSNLGVGLLALCVCLPLVGLVELQHFEFSMLLRLGYATAYALALVCLSFSFIGAALRWLPGESRSLRYLADASYWMYLAHLPLVMALQTAIMFVPLHWSVKLVALNGVACALLLWSYRHWVRPTWLGELLNGRRHPRPVRGAVQANAATSGAVD